MARLWSSGFELNSVTAGVEFTGLSSSPTIVTSPIRSGTYAGRTAGASRFIYDTHSTATQGIFYCRFYFQVSTAPGFDQHILRSTPPSLGASNIDIRIGADRALALWNSEDSAQIGSDSAALDLDTWYRIELKVDTTTLASTVVDARIDGVSFASGTVNLADGVGGWVFGGQNGGTSEVFYYDDIAINDSTGSFQNSWPGEGSIIHLRPNATGDNNQLGAAASTNWQAVDEITPDDTTTKIVIDSGVDTVGEIDDYNIDDTPVAIGSGDTINVVQVGIRYAGAAASSDNDSIALRIKASASGTVEESSNITPASQTYVTNADVAPRNYSLTLYDLPGASTTAYTKADLDTTQIGFKKTVDAGNGTLISTLWLLVEYTPASATTSTSTTSTSSSTSTSTTSTSSSTSRTTSTSTTSTSSSTSTSTSTTSTSTSTSTTSTSTSRTTSTSTSTTSTSSSTSTSRTTSTSTTSTSTSSSTSTSRTTSTSTTSTSSSTSTTVSTTTSTSSSSSTSSTTTLAYAIVVTRQVQMTGDYY